MLWNEKKVELSVIMPALNEENNIVAAIDDTLLAFKAFDIVGEIIVIDDGSTDRTKSLIEHKVSENPGFILLICHNKPMGIGNSFWDGVDEARGGVVVMLPGDNENDPCETLRYYSLLEHVDMVIPFIFNRQARSLLRNLLSFFYRFVINTTFLVNFNYTNGTILYRRSILKELKSRSNGFFFQTDILIRSFKRGYLFAEVPYKLGMRKNGVSKAVSFPSLVNVIKGYLRLMREYYFIKDETVEVGYSQDSQTAIRRK